MFGVCVCFSLVFFLFGSCCFVCCTLLVCCFVCGVFVVSCFQLVSVVCVCCLLRGYGHIFVVCVLIVASCSLLIGVALSLVVVRTLLFVYV